MSVCVSNRIFAECFGAGHPERNLGRLDGRVGGLVNSRCKDRFHGLGMDSDTIGHHQLGLYSGFGGKSGLDQAVKKGVGCETSGYGLAKVDEGITFDRGWSGGEKLSAFRFRDPSGGSRFTT